MPNLNANRGVGPEEGGRGAPKGSRVDWRFKGSSTTQILFVTQEPDGKYYLWHESYGKKPDWTYAYGKKSEAITALNEAAGHSHRPNRNLTRFQLERLLADQGGFSRTEVANMTDDQIRRHIGADRLRDSGDMVRNPPHGHREPKFEVGDRVTRVDDSSYVGKIGHIGGDQGPAYGGFQYKVDWDNGAPRHFVPENKLRLSRAHSANGRREAPDETAARELSLYIENDYPLVGAPNSQGKSIEKNLLAKARKGVFDFALSEKLWMYLIESGAKKYAKEFASSESEWSRMFNKPTRELVAHEFAESFAIENNLPTK